MTEAKEMKNDELDRQEVDQETDRSREGQVRVKKKKVQKMLATSDSSRTDGWGYED